jgi:hypothetical protein
VDISLIFIVKEELSDLNLKHGSLKLTRGGVTKTTAAVELTAA